MTVTDDWEQRVAAALELQQRPRRPVWRLVGIVVALMIAAYFVISFAFGGGLTNSNSNPGDARAPLRANTTFGLDDPPPTVGRESLRAQTAASGSTPSTLPDQSESARLYEVRVGVSDGVREAFLLETVAEGVADGVERGMASWDDPVFGGGRVTAAPPLPPAARLETAPVGGATSNADTSFEAFDTFVDGDAPVALTEAAPVDDGIFGFDDPLPIEPIDGPSPRAPSGVWVGPPGVRVAVVFTVTPDGSATDVAPAPGVQGINPLILSAAVGAVESSLYPPLQDVPGGAYRAVQMVTIPPTDALNGVSSGGLTSRGVAGAATGAGPQSAATNGFDDFSAGAAPAGPSLNPVGRTAPGAISGADQAATTARSSATAQPAARRPGSPVWLERPTAQDVIDAYPRRARRNNLSGAVVLNCQINPVGALQCDVASETPRNAGFGEAALSLTRWYVAGPTLSNGAPAGNHSFQLPVEFNVQ